MKTATLTVIFALSIIHVSISQNSIVDCLNKTQQQLSRNKDTIVQIPLRNLVINEFRKWNTKILKNPFRPRKSYKKATHTFDEQILLNTLEKLFKHYGLNSNISTELV